MNKFTYWVARTLGLKITYYCTYTSWDRGSACKCQQYLHSGNHYRCFHCTNPEIECRFCGGRYIDKEEPGLQWKYRGLFKGWEHTRCRGR